MITKNKIKTDKSLNDQLRDIRDKVSLEIQDMTLEQLKEYIESKKTLCPTHWQ